MLVSFDNALTISISDNGKGIALNTINEGNGLSNMHKRVEALNGKFELINANGATVHFTIPIKSLSNESVIAKR
jgi:signal transduction histidine kinase